MRLSTRLARQHWSRQALEGRGPSEGPGSHTGLGLKPRTPLRGLVLWCAINISCRVQDVGKDQWKWTGDLGKGVGCRKYWRGGSRRNSQGL